MVGPASERAASFARHLPESGWDPVVVTVKQGLFHSDPRQQQPPVRSLRTRSPEVGRALRTLPGLPGAGSPADDGSVAADGVVRELSGPLALDRVRGLVRDYLYLPDALAPWIPFAVAGARRALRIAPAPAVLVSTSVPYSAHLAALAVARRGAGALGGRAARPVGADRLPDPPPPAYPKGNRRRARGAGGRRGERSRGHIRADPRGDGAGLPRHGFASLGRKERVRAQHRRGATAAGEGGA